VVSPGEAPCAVSSSTGQTFILFYFHDEFVKGMSIEVAQEHA
jgi:hypothetical protein